MVFAGNQSRRRRESNASSSNRSRLATGGQANQNSDLKECLQKSKSRLHPSRKSQGFPSSQWSKGKRNTTLKQMQITEDGEGKEITIEGHKKEILEQKDGMDSSMSKEEPVSALSVYEQPPEIQTKADDDMVVFQQFAQPIQTTQDETFMTVVPESKIVKKEKPMRNYILYELGS